MTSRYMTDAVLQLALSRGKLILELPDSHSGSYYAMYSVFSVYKHQRVIEAFTNCKSSHKNRCRKKNERRNHTRTQEILVSKQQFKG